MKTILTLLAAAATLILVSGNAHAANYTVEDAKASSYCPTRTYSVNVYVCGSWKVKYYGKSYTTARRIYDNWRCKGYQVKFR